VRGALAGLSPREKRLLILLGVVFAVLVFLGLYWWSSTRLDAIERDRADTVDALRTIQRLRPRIAARNAQRDAILLRFRTRAPALTSFVEEQARAANVQVSESQDRPATPAGRRFTERSVSIRLRAVGLDALADFMDRIESAEFPVAITSIRIRRRPGERNRFDVDDMVIATWDQTPAAPRSDTNRAERTGP
jgi:type II secretory pathway component PulM